MPDNRKYRELKNENRPGRRRRRTRNVRS